MRKIGGFLIGLIIVLGVIVAARNILIVQGIKAGVKTVTGLEVVIEQMHIGLLRPVIDVRGFKLLNPEGFPDKTMISVPVISVVYDFPSLFQKKVSVKKMTLDLQEMDVIRNQKGEVNVQAMQKLMNQKGGGELPQVRIDVLDLKIGKVVFKDYSLSGTPKVSEFKIGLNERVENITDPKALIALIMSKALKNTALAQISGLDMKAMEAEMKGNLKELEGKTEQIKTQVDELKKKAQDLLKGYAPK